MSAPSLSPPASLTTKDNQFILCNDDMIKLQVFLTKGVILPTTKDQFITRYTLDKDGENSFDNIPGLADLVPVYASVNGHATNFQNVTLPETINLSNDIYHYAQQVPTYYNGILKVITDWQNAPDDASPQLIAAYKKKLGALLDHEISYLNQSVERAQKVVIDITQFSLDVTTDKANLETPYNIVHTKLDGQGGLIADYNKKIVDWTNKVQEANDRYTKDITIACTTPTYGWIWPIGTIAAAIVAGIYGHDAQAALEEAAMWRAQVQTEQGLLLSAIHLNAELTSVQLELDPFYKAIAGVIDVISKLQGVWGAISSDLSSIKRGINDNILDADILIKDLGVDEAITEWAALQQLVDKYRLAAYITVTDLPTNNAAPAS